MGSSLMLRECCNLQRCCAAPSKTMDIRMDVYACVVTGEREEGREGREEVVRR